MSIVDALDFLQIIINVVVIELRDYLIFLSHLGGHVGKQVVDEVL